MDKNKFTETLKKMCDLALESKTMCNVKVYVYIDKSTKCEDPKPPKIICNEDDYTKCTLPKGSCELCTF